MARRKTQKRASKKSKNRGRRSIFAYPLAMFLLLCSGVFLLAWTFRVNADVLVTAKVSAPFVTAPAVITSPADGAHVTSIPINVSGTCPANAGYVEIFDNGLMRGTAICSGGVFQLSSDLFPGANSLVARVFNITDDEGPASAAVNVIYDTSQPPTGGGTTPGSGGTSSGGNPPAASPLSLKTSFIYKGYHVGQPVEWPIVITGGAAPYAISVDWGDGTSDVLSRSQPGQFKISHTYTEPGKIKNSFTIKIKASDASGDKAFLQFFVIVTPESVGAAGNIFSKPPPQIGTHISWLWLAWPVYGVVLLMAVSYKLGEKEELLILKKRGVLHHR
jgi:hypothetical protein